VLKYLTSNTLYIYLSTDCLPPEPTKLIEISSQKNSSPSYRADLLAFYHVLWKITAKHHQKSLKNMKNSGIAKGITSFLELEERIDPNLKVWWIFHEPLCCKKNPKVVIFVLLMARKKFKLRKISVPVEYGIKRLQVPMPKKHSMTLSTLQMGNHWQIMKMRSGILNQFTFFSTIQLGLGRPSSIDDICPGQASRVVCMPCCQ